MYREDIMKAFGIDSNPTMLEITSEFIKPSYEKRLRAVAISEAGVCRYKSLAGEVIKYVSDLTYSEETHFCMESAYRALGRLDTPRTSQFLMYRLTWTSFPKEQGLILQALSYQTFFPIEEIVVMGLSSSNDLIVLDCIEAAEQLLIRQLQTRRLLRALRKLIDRDYIDIVAFSLRLLAYYGSKRDRTLVRTFRDDEREFYFYPTLGKYVRNELFFEEQIAIGRLR